MSAACTAAATATILFVAVVVLVSCLFFAGRSIAFAATGGFVVSTGTTGGFLRAAFGCALSGTATIATTESVLRRKDGACG